MTGGLYRKQICRHRFKRWEIQTWRKAVDACHILTSPAYHLLRRSHGLSSLPSLGKQVAAVSDDPCLAQYDPRDLIFSKVKGIVLHDAGRHRSMDGITCFVFGKALL